MTRPKLVRSYPVTAIHLPTEMAFPDDVKEVVIRREGGRRVILPANATWDDFFDAPGSDLGERGHPAE
jgi:antitoxin VapB